VTIEDERRSAAARFTCKDVALRISHPGLTRLCNWRIALTLICRPDSEVLGGTPAGRNVT
jgi:hypothetical protein